MIKVIYTFENMDKIFLSRKWGQISQISCNVLICWFAAIESSI